MPESFDPYQRWLGIAPAEQPPHHYRLLGLPLWEDRKEVIQRAADDQSALLRTYQVGPQADVCHRLLHELAAARACLLSPEKKAAYDTFLRGRQPASGKSAVPAVKPPPYPVVEPTDDSALVELDDRTGRHAVGARTTDDGIKPPRQKRWLGLGAAVLALLLLLGIVSLAWMLAWQTPPDRQQSAQVGADRQRGQNYYSDNSSDPFVPDEEDAWELLLESLEAEEDAPPQEPATATAAAEKTTPQPPARAAPPQPKQQPSKEPPDRKLAKAGMPAPPVEPSRIPEEPDEPEAPRVKPLELKPEPFKSDSRIDAIIAEAWVLIRQGDHDGGRQRLVQAGKVSHDDLRVDFSLGLIEALITRDWTGAERHFQACVQQHPTHVASLNNLALARLRLNKENLTLKNWQVASLQRPVPPEIVQNLGRLQHLLDTGILTAKPAFQKSLGNLYAEAKAGGTRIFDPKVGFRYLGLYGGGDPEFGWRDLRDYEDCWCPVCNGTSKTKCPKADCNHGMVTRMASKYVGINPMTKSPVYQSGTVRIPCPTCRGTGWTVCIHCRGGKDRNLSRPAKESE